MVLPVGVTVCPVMLVYFPVTGRITFKQIRISLNGDSIYLQNDTLLTHISIFGSRSLSDVLLSSLKSFL